MIAQPERVRLAAEYFTLEKMRHDQELDTRGLNCPLPILRTKKALSGIQSGQVLRIVATDPGAVKDFQNFAKQTGHTLVSHSEANGEFTFLLQKK